MVAQACLVRDGRIIAAAQEERFTRKKHDAGYPGNAVEYCLREGNITMEAVDYVAFYEKPFMKFDRILHSYLACAPAGLMSFLKAIPLWIKEKIWIKSELRRQLNFEDHSFRNIMNLMPRRRFIHRPFTEAAF